MNLMVGGDYNKEEEVPLGTTTTTKTKNNNKNISLF